MVRKLVAPMAVLVLVLAGCSDSGDDEVDTGSGDTTATTASGGAVALADWIEQADAVCADFNDQMDALGEPESEDEFASFLAQAEEYFNQEREALAALGLPDEKADQVEEALGLLDQQAEIVAEARSQAEDGDLEAVFTTMDEGSQLNDQADALAAEIGLTECGSSDDSSDEPVGDIPDSVPDSRPGDDSVGVGGDAYTYGDDPDLDVLWDDCDGGNGAACDELFWTSPSDSEYESFGNTCGGRFSEDEVPFSCEDELGGSKVDPPVSDEANAYGDDPALDALWDDCDGGDLAACDQLFWDSPIGSEYEAFGNTCGERYPEDAVPYSCEEGE